jgi:glutaredoxin
MIDKYILYVKKGCPFCVRAVALLEERQEHYQIIALGDDQRLINEVKIALDWPTFPVVYSVSSEEKVLKLIGGYTDLYQHFESLDV